jgi:hypothetical protein
VKDEAPYRPRNECPNGKLGWETKAQARTAAARSARTVGADRGYYKCPHCRRYHVTKAFDYATTRRAVGAR